jgi:DNA modification methylase
MASWGTLPGAYIVPSERKPVVGGKPLSAMEALVRDYSRPSDLVCDPCCGGGTTLVAAKLLGRRFIGGDIDDKHVEIARKRVSAITMGRPLALNFGDVG